LVVTGRQSLSELVFESVGFFVGPVLVATTHNVLIKKVGLCREGWLEVVDFERYVHLFNE
jgi:hypothetical protein